MRNPMQPVYLDQHNVMRFKRNKIIDYLFNMGKIDLNELSIIEDMFPQTDWEQLAQLLGYSICGFHELSYVSDETAAEASRLAKAIVPEAGGCRDKGCEIHCGVDRG